MGDIIFSKGFGPTDTTADTMTTIGAASQFPPIGTTIESIRVSYGNVVNAKESASLVFITVPGVPGSPFSYAFGNGTGGATNSNNSGAEAIPCKIPVPANTNVTVKIISPEALKDCIVSLSASGGMQAPEMTLEAGGAGQDTTADTLLALTVNAKTIAIGAGGLTPYRDGIIRKIRFASSGIVDAKAQSAILYLNVSGHPYALEFGVGKGSGGAATSSTADADAINNLGIPVKANSTVGVSILSSEVTLSVTVSIQCD